MILAESRAKKYHRFSPEQQNYRRSFIASTDAARLNLLAPTALDDIAAEEGAADGAAYFNEAREVLKSGQFSRPVIDDVLWTIAERWQTDLTYGAGFVEPPKEAEVLRLASESAAVEKKA